MGALIIRRVLQGIPVLVAVSIILFMLLFVGPNPLEQLKQNPNYRAEDIARLTEKYGWNKPKHEQYLTWATNFVQGDFGDSIQTQRPAREMILERLPLTLMLTGLSMMFSLMIAIPVGAYMAMRQYSRADYFATVVTFGMMATPSFFLALLFQLFAVKLQDSLGGTMVFFTGGAPSDMGNVKEMFQRMTLPVVALSLLQIAGWSRFQRSELLNVLNSDYIRSAMAKGIPKRRILIGHAMRNTWLALVTIVAIDIATLFGGAVITETIFGLPGMGTLLLDSVRNRDVVVALDITMIGAFLMVLFNMIADIVYGMLDPRVRVS